MRTTFSRRRLAASTSAIAIMAMATPTLVSAASCVWNTTTGSWANAGDWSCGAQPGAGDDAVIATAGAVVSLTSLTANVGTLDLEGGDAATLNNSYLTVHNTSVTNNGTITLANASRLYGSAAVNFGGTGTIVLDDSTNYAQMGGNYVVYTLGAGQTVRGSGQVGFDQSYVVNNGLISADVSGRTITLDPYTGSAGAAGTNLGGGDSAATFYNTGTLQATGGGTLTFNSGRYNNSATGVVQALNGSTVNLANDSRIVGGTLTTAGTGVITAAGGTNYLTNVTLSTGSAYTLNNNYTYLNTAITNNGTITIAGSSRLDAETSVALNGSGVIKLDDSGGYAQLGGNYVAYTLGASQVVHGSGEVALDQSYVVNNGLISADTTTGSGQITIDAYGGNGGVSGANLGGTDANATFYNTAILQATNGGVLNVSSGRYENSAGAVIQALNGSTVNLNNDSRIINGTLKTVGTGVINAYNGNNYLQGVTLDGGTTYNLNNNYTWLNGGIVNNGTITIANGSRLVSEAGPANLSGAGTIVLNDTANYAQLGGNYVLYTIGSGQVVHGSGQIGFDQSYVINNGLISSDAGRSITLDGYGGNGGVGGAYGVDGVSTFVNNATIQATNASTVYVNGGRYDNTSGVIQAINGSSLVLNNDARIIGGALASDATSTISATSANTYLNTVTLTGGTRYNTNNTYTWLIGGITNNGTITLANGSRLESQAGPVTLSGTGVIVLDNSVSYAQIGGNYLLYTIGSGQIVRGSGQVGFDQSYVVNNGLISSDVGGNIAIDGYGGNGGVGGAYGVDGLSTFVNNSTIQATNASTLTIGGGRYDNTSGVIRAINGSTMVLGNDARIVGGVLTSDATSAITATSVNIYLNHVTLSAGTQLNANNANTYVNGSITNDGTITIANGSRLSNEGANTLDGAGVIVLDNSLSYAVIGGNYVTTTIGAGQTVRGSGQIGFDQSYIVNNGVISADVAAGGITVDGYGGSGGISGSNLGGADANATFYNTGTMQATNGSTLAYAGGSYENAAGATMAAYTGSTVVMNGDASLYNLQAGGVLNKGVYVSSTTGAASTLNLRSNAANGITQIGTNAAGTDTVVTLNGANSVLNVLNFGSGVPATIDSTLTTVARSGELDLYSRNMTITAGGGAFTNAGIVRLDPGATFGAATYANSGLTYGNGTITVAITNSGTVEANGGTLATRAITGATGTIQSDAGATLDISAAAGDSTAGNLVNNGALALGGHNITVTNNYTNASFGLGNAFNNHANVSGAGLILAAGATMDLSGPALTGNTLNVGNVRTGGSSSTTLIITNNGALTNLVGAVQNTNAPSVQLTGADWTAAANGGSATVGISYTGLVAGSLAGQSLNVVNNFDNVASRTINIVGNVYQVAVAGAQPATLTLAARRVGDAAATAGLTISNTAPATGGYTESLSSTASTGGGFLVNGVASTTVGPLGAGASAPVTVSLGTGAAGAFSHAVTISNTSIQVAGEGLGNLALADQSVTVTGNVYAPAVASLSGNTVNFGVVRQGAASPTGAVTVTNTAVGSLTDALNTSASGLPAGVAASAPGALAAGQSGTVGFSLNTATAGVVSGTGSLDFTSTDAELAPLSLASQSVSFTGTVTQLASALLSKDAGAGSFSGSGSHYTLNLGSFTAGQTANADLAVTNNIANTAYGELLGGSFTHSGSSAFSFTGAAFSGLVGGASDTGNVLDFNATGLSAGLYTETITLNGFSQFAGLANYGFAPITVTVDATVTGGVGGVPEPTAWVMMLAGLGLIGGTVRRRRAVARRA